MNEHLSFQVYAFQENILLHHFQVYAFQENILPYHFSSLRLMQESSFQINAINCYFNIVFAFFNIVFAFITLSAGPVAAKSTLRRAIAPKILEPTTLAFFLLFWRPFSAPLILVHRV